MKPLTQIKIRRDVLPSDCIAAVDRWIPAADQATDAGRMDFWRRQQERMKRVQAEQPKVDAAVITLKRERK